MLWGQITASLVSDLMISERSLLNLKVHAEEERSHLAKISGTSGMRLCWEQTDEVVLRVPGEGSAMGEMGAPPTFLSTCRKVSVLFSFNQVTCQLPPGGVCR